MSDIYANLWNFDPSKAPKSYVTFTTRMIKGKPTEIPTTHSIYILAADYLTSGLGVTKTRWMPDQERWEGWVKGKEPIAWLPWPSAPALEAL